MTAFHVDRHYKSIHQKWPRRLAESCSTADWNS